ncbi:MAG: nucleotide exchange factor GrpE [Pyrinomonadaceae bacterium]
MSSDHEDNARKIPIHFAGDEDKFALEPEVLTDDSASEIEAIADPGHEFDLTADDGSEIIDADSAPSLSEILKELEAQDQAEAEAMAKLQTAELEPASVTKGERATAALAHQALTELAGLRAENAQLRKRATDAEVSKLDTLDRLLRLQADFDNLRKRTERERGDSHSRLVIDLAKKLLPVIDSISRALKAEDSFQAAESEEFRHFLGGVSLISKQLNDVLESFGIEAIPAIGQRFDPNFHEAVATELSDELAPDVITQELARGYRMGSKLLRPSMVKVSSKP